MRKSPTVAEAKLWQVVRGKRLAGLKFRRQAPVGRYIVDFLCVQERLIIELDGPFHDLEQDANRDTWLRGQGFRVLRYSNANLTEETDRVINHILANVRRGPPKQPSPLAGEGRPGRVATAAG